ncbi:hypothetical protein GRI72_02750 [Altererythrobacter marinus]|uniref:Uncharacterized protein n=1 Tax=Pelagerythrobacter marinus TaxID=538382 RepID=A0ABW9US98_9SPHN|nr:hypothetical protein [Pelagerythrobacter marinus]MXO67751.1 hypothetical protein [Pelagerythrobacter marinus]
MNSPYLKRWQKMNRYPRDGESWDEFYKRTAQGIEARSDETRSGSAEGKSPVAESDAPKGGQ